MGKVGFKQCIHSLETSKSTSWVINYKALNYQFLNMVKCYLTTMNISNWPHIIKYYKINRL